MPPRPKARRRTAPPERWSQRVTEGSNALDLEPGVFTCDDPAAIARSLKASAEASRHRKTTPVRSAMSMLTFYVNRARRQLDDAQPGRLEAAKDELRALYGRCTGAVRALCGRCAGAVRALCGRPRRQVRVVSR